MGEFEEEVEEGKKKEEWVWPGGTRRYEWERADVGKAKGGCAGPWALQAALVGEEKQARCLSAGRWQPDLPATTAVTKCRISGFCGAAAPWNTG